MINWFQRRKFEKAVTDTVERRLLEIHGLELGGECAGCFATGIMKGREIGAISPDLVNSYRKAGLSIDQAAMAFLDTSITLIKRFAPNALTDPDVSRIVTAMEKAVDQLFLEKPGMIVPMNGTAGPMMESFTKPWNP